jgi:hypothetical protein
MTDEPTDDACRTVEVDGETVLLRGEGELTERERQFAAEIVRAAKRKFEAERAKATPFIKAGRMAAAGFASGIRLHQAEAAVERVRQLATAYQTEGANGEPTDVDTLWPSEVLAALYPNQGAVTMPDDATLSPAREVIAAAIRDFPFDDYGLDNLSYALANAPGTQEWVPALAAAVLDVVLPLTRITAGLARDSEATVQRVISLYEQWVKAGPPPLGAPLARWWDRRLVELHHAIHPTTDQPQEQNMAEYSTQQNLRLAQQMLDQQGQITDLTKERDGAYRERAHLVALLAALTPGAVITYATDVDEPGWQIVYLNIGGHQASWHISPRDADLFQHVERVEHDVKIGIW